MAALNLSKFYNRQDSTIRSIQNPRSKIQNRKTRNAQIHHFRPLLNFSVSAKSTAKLSGSITTP